MTVTIEDIYNFFKKFPQHKSKIHVNSRFGYYPIEECDITAPMSEVYDIETKNLKLKCSPNHRLLINNEWKMVKDIKYGDVVDTKNGDELVKNITKLKIKEDLYDIQVHHINEYFSNGITSHNSTLCQSLYYCLFGETLDSLKKENIINYVTGKGCNIELYFTVTKGNETKPYKVVRTLKPSKLSIYSGYDDLTRDTIGNTQSFLNDLIEANTDVFKNCIIMSVNSSQPFMAKSKIDKRKFIEGIFDLSVFSEMLKQVRKDYNECNREYEVESGKITEVQTALSNYIEQRDNFDSDNKTRIKELKERITSIEEEKQEVQNKIDSFTEVDLSSYESKLKEIDDKEATCDSNMEKIRTAEAKVNSAISNKKDQYKGYDKDTECPTCKRPYDNIDPKELEKRKEEILKEIESLKEKLQEVIEKKSKVNENISKLRSARSKVNDAINSQKIKKQKIESLKDNIKSYDSRITEVEKDIESISNKTNQFDKLVKDTEKRFKDINKALDSFKDELKIMNYIKFIVAEEGVKSYLVKRILELFNSRLAYYLNKLDSNCIVTFDEYFEDTILSEKGVNCSYYNFSGAERKAIDLACLFSFSDIRRLQGTVNYNIAFFDELFDSSFDSKGIELINEILTDRIEEHNESVFVISHRKESTKWVTGDLIMLEKENGTTRRVECEV